MQPIAHHPAFVYFVLFVSQAISSGHILLSRYALVIGAEPLVLICARLIIALPFLMISGHIALQAQLAGEGAALLASPTPKEELLTKAPVPSTRQKQAMYVLGLFGVMLNLSANMYGMQLTNASTTGFAMAAIPIFTAIILILTKMEQMTLGRIIAILLALTGAIFMMNVESFTMDLGIMILFGSSFLTASFYVGQKPLVTVLPPLYVVAQCFLAATICSVIAVLPVYHEISALMEAPYMVWVAIIYAAIANTAIVYPLNAFGIRNSSPLVVGLFANVMPVVSAILAYFFLDETITESQIIGGVFILAGVFVMTVTRFREARQKLLDTVKSEVEESTHNTDSFQTLIEEEPEPEALKESIDMDERS